MAPKARKAEVSPTAQEYIERSRAAQAERQARRRREAAFAAAQRAVLDCTWDEWVIDPDNPCRSVSPARFGQLVRSWDEREYVEAFVRTKMVAAVAALKTVKSDGFNPSSLFPFESTARLAFKRENEEAMGALFRLLYEQPESVDQVVTDLTACLREGREHVRHFHDFYVGLADRVRRARDGAPDRHQQVRAQVSHDGTSASHNENFTWVNWFGCEYVFKAGNQASVVRELWGAWEKNGRRGGCGLTAEELGERVGSSSLRFRVDSTFREHLALGRMIVRTPQGTWALARPSGAPD